VVHLVIVLNKSEQLQSATLVLTHFNNAHQLTHVVSMVIVLFPLISSRIHVHATLDMNTDH
jgi:hypothetical protein